MFGARPIGTRCRRQASYAAAITRAHVGVLGWRPVGHLRPDGRTEDADGRERADRRDPLDRLDGVRDRLDAGDHLARHGAARQPRRAVLHRVEEQLLAERARLSGAHPREPRRDRAARCRTRNDRRPGRSADRTGVKSRSGVSCTPTSIPTSSLMARTNGSANSSARPPWKPPFRCTNVTSDSSFAAQHVSTTSSTVFAALSTPPTFWPVVQKRQFRSERPELADRIDVDAEIGALQHADLRHRDVARGQSIVPTRLPGDVHGIARTIPLIEDRVAHRVGRRACTARSARTLDDGRVHPDRGLEPGAGRDRQLQAGAEPCARAADPARAFQRHIGRNAQPVTEEIDFELARIERRHGPPEGNAHATHLACLSGISVALRGGCVFFRRPARKHPGGPFKRLNILAPTLKLRRTTILADCS